MGRENPHGPKYSFKEAHHYFQGFHFITDDAFVTNVPVKNFWIPFNHLPHSRFSWSCPHVFGLLVMFPNIGEERSCLPVRLVMLMTGGWEWVLPLFQIWELEMGVSSTPWHSMSSTEFVFLFVYFVEPCFKECPGSSDFCLGVVLDGCFWQKAIFANTKLWPSWVNRILGYYILFYFRREY